MAGNYRSAFCCLLFLLWTSSATAQLQHRVDSRNLYYRCYAIVPFIGKGTPEDPRRPKYTPAPSEVANQVTANSADKNPKKEFRSGLLGWAMVESDDGKSALVEFVFANPSDLKEVLADASIQTFEPGKVASDQILSAFQKHRKDFNFRHFGAKVQ